MAIDRQIAVEGKRVDLGGRRSIKKKKKKGGGEGEKGKERNSKTKEEKAEKDLKREKN